MFGKNLTLKKTKNKTIVDSGFSNELYDKKRKHGNAGNNTKLSESKSNSVKALPLLQNR